MDLMTKVLMAFVLWVAMASSTMQTFACQFVLSGGSVIYFWESSEPPVASLLAPFICPKMI